MRRLLAALVVFASAFAIATPDAWAGSPHFIASSLSTSTSGSTISVSGKEAGLGNESQVHIVLTATAACINGGGKHPKAVNQTSVTASGTFPVQNGKANFTLTATAAFTPDCSPPMTVAFSDVMLTDTTNNISVTLR